MFRLDTYTNYAQSFIDYLSTVTETIGDFPVEEMSTQNFTSRSDYADYTCL